MQSHENAHEVMRRAFDAYDALPKSRAKTLTPAKRARIEASKKCHQAIKWHLGGDFHRHDDRFLAWRRSHIWAFATTEQLVEIHDQLHADD